MPGLVVIVAQASTAQQAPGPPTADTDGATGVGVKDATIHGTVNPNGSETTYHFRYGRTRHYQHGTQPQVLPAGTDDVPVEAHIDKLRFGRRYHYALVAKNAFGTTVGDDRSFRTDEPLIKGDYRVELRIVKGGDAFGQHRGQKVTRGYHFDPRRCQNTRCRRLHLVRHGKRGKFGMTMHRRSVAAFGGQDSFSGWCDDGLRFDSTARIRVRAKTAPDDRAGKVSGTFRVRAQHCTHGSERARLRGEAR